MLRLRFGVDDVARTRFALPPLLCELAGSVQAIQQPGSGFRRRWWARRAPVPVRVRPLLGLVPGSGSVPGFLIPEVDGCLDETIDLVQATPAQQIQSELAVTHPSPARAPWAGELAAGRMDSRRELGWAVRTYHDHVLAPLLPAMREVAAVEVRRRAWQLATQGLEETLNMLHPLIHWRDGVLEIGFPIDADVHLGGRGLCLAPSTAWTRPGFAFHWLEQPGLVYPSPTPHWYPSAAGSDQQKRLAELLGATRARVMWALTSEHSTSSLAANLGISPASASTHAAALRGAGLVTTRRDGRAVRHVLTELGRHMLSAPGTAAGEGIAQVASLPAGFGGEPAR